MKEKLGALGFVVAAGCTAVWSALEPAAFICGISNLKGVGAGVVVGASAFGALALKLKTGFDAAAGASDFCSGAADSVDLLANEEAAFGMVKNGCVP